MARLNDAILRVPTFVPNFTAVENFECQQHGKIFLRQLRGYKLWALQSKSILSSNIIFLLELFLHFSFFFLYFFSSLQHAQRVNVPNNSVNILLSSGIVFVKSVLDSSAKVPSGMLRGNVNQLGDFDECLGVMAHVKLNEKTIRVQGKYCLANIDLYPSHPDMKLPVNMMQARSFIRGSMYDVSSIFSFSFFIFSQTIPIFAIFTKSLNFSISR